MTDANNDSSGTCSHCGWAELKHQDEHAGLCCDCFDLSWGMALADLNRERAAKGRPPIARPWPVRS